MLAENVKTELDREDPTEFHTTFLSHCLSLADLSRKHMQTFYGNWDQAQNAYRAWQQLDKADKKAILEGRPTKQRVPAVYAKVQTFKSFVTTLYFQRARFYELEPIGMEDQDYRDLAETLLDSDCRSNRWFNLMSRWAVNVGKYGLGILKHSWEEEFAYLQKTVFEEPTKFFGLAYSKAKETKMTVKVPKRLGNRVVNVSPYNFLPDPRVPLTRLEEGEFCADESDMSLADLTKKEAEGLCAGIKHVSVLSSDRVTFRRQYNAMRGSKIDFNNLNGTKNTVRVIEMQIKVIPSLFMLADGTPLGEESYPVKYLVWIANDERIIRLESMAYLHDCFTWDVGLYDEDDENFLSTSLVELITPLQDTADWFFNSRVANVGQNLEDKLVVDPLTVQMDTIHNRGRVILLRKGASRSGIDNAVKQLTVSDVTANHMNDVANIGSMINSVSGYNENLSGNYTSGRRSAAESRVVTQAGAMRPKAIAQALWGACIGPLGQKLLTNLRQGLTPDLIVRNAGQQYAMPEKQAIVVAFTSTPEELLRSCDLFVYEGTLESEKTYLAQHLTELLGQILQLGPTGLVQMDLSPKLLLQKIYELQGIGPLEPYSLQKDPQTLMAVVQQIAQQMAMQMVQQQSATPAAPTPQPQ